MSKNERIRQQSLHAKEAEFDALLPICLRQCADGRWGLFGQNSFADPEDRYWAWPEAKQLRTLAAEIFSERARLGESNVVCEKFICLCEDKGADTRGEPKLAAAFLEEFKSASSS